MVHISQRLQRAVNTVPQDQKINWRKQLTPIIVGVMIVVIFFFGVNPYIQTMKQSTFIITKTSSIQTTTTQTATKTTTTTTTSSVTITSTITQTTTTSTTEAPIEIRELALYTLKLINDDRAAVGLAPVALGSNAAAQSHAEDLARLDWLSHWGQMV